MSSRLSAFRSTKRDRRFFAVTVFSFYKICITPQKTDIPVGDFRDFDKDLDARQKGCKSDR